MIRTWYFYLQFNVRRKAASSQLTQGCDQLTEEDVISWLMARFG
jgi:hypothetical protein